MATTRAARSSSFAVRAPRPGPISITRSAGSGQTADAIRSRMDPLMRKCWPSFRGTRPLAPQPGARVLEHDLLQAPGGLPVNGGGREARKQDEALHFIGELAAGEIVDRKSVV